MLFDENENMSAATSCDAVMKKRELERRRRVLMNTRFVQLEESLEQSDMDAKRPKTDHSSRHPDGKSAKGGGGASKSDEPQLSCSAEGRKRCDKEQILMDACVCICKYKRRLAEARQQTQVILREMQELRDEKQELRGDKQLIRNEMDLLREENFKLKADNITLWQSYRKRGMSKAEEQPKIDFKTRDSLLVPTEKDFIRARDVELDTANVATYKTAAATPVGETCYDAGPVDEDYMNRFIADSNFDAGSIPLADDLDGVGSGTLLSELVMSMR